MKKNDTHSNLLWLGDDILVFADVVTWAERLRWKCHHVARPNLLLKALKCGTCDLVVLETFINQSNSLLHLPEIRELAPQAVIASVVSHQAPPQKNSILNDLHSNYVDYNLPVDFGRNALEALLIDTRYRKLHAINPRHVLVIEDNSPIRKIILRALKQHAYRVSEARSAEEALDRADLAHVDAVITDIFIPGIGGIEAIQRFRQHWPEIGIIAISGDNINMSAQKSLLAAAKVGADATLAKPFDDKDLIATLDGVLKAKYLAA